MVFLGLLWAFCSESRFYCKSSILRPKRMHFYFYVNIGILGHFRSFLLRRVFPQKKMVVFVRNGHNSIFKSNLVFSGVFCVEARFHPKKCYFSSETIAVKLSSRTWCFGAFWGRFVKTVVSTQTSEIFRPKGTQLNFRVKLSLFLYFRGILIKKSFPLEK